MILKPIFGLCLYDLEQVSFISEWPYEEGNYLYPSWTYDIEAKRNM